MVGPQQVNQSGFDNLLNGLSNIAVGGVDRWVDMEINKASEPREVKQTTVNPAESQQVKRTQGEQNNDIAMIERMRDASQLQMLGAAFVVFALVVMLVKLK